jgi:hypothetical protein
MGGGSVTDGPGAHVRACGQTKRGLRRRGNDSRTPVTVCEPPSAVIEESAGSPCIGGCADSSCSVGWGDAVEKTEVKTPQILERLGYM